MKCHVVDSSKDEKDLEDEEPLANWRAKQNRPLTTTTSPRKGAALLPPPPEKSSYGQPLWS